MINRKILTGIFFLLSIGVTQLTAQEINCNISVNHVQIQGTNTQVFLTLEKALSEFVNTRHWTTARYDANERIHCSMNLTVREYDEADARWNCELIVQSTRPVWQSAYRTPVFTFKDTDVSFHYREFEPLELREGIIDNNLIAVISYYVYLIIGWDMDTMSLLGGTETLRKAESIVAAAQTLGEPGWRAFENSRNRYALISDYLEESMLPLRRLMYVYHRLGLDELLSNVNRIRLSITEGLGGLEQAWNNKRISVLPVLFTEIKKEELINLYSRGTVKEKEEVCRLLSTVNPSLTMEWDKIKR